MPGLTPRGYPYPLYTEANNFPAQDQALATAIDTDVDAQLDRITTALTAPSVRVSATANQLIAISTDTFVTFATEDFDNAAMGNLGVNNDRITFTQTGIYLVSAEVNFVQNGNATTNGRQVVLVSSALNEVAWNSRRGASNLDTEITCPILYRVVAPGDFMRVRVRHNSGAAVNVSARSLSATKVSD